MFAEVKKLSKGTLIAAVIVLIFVMCACSGLGAAIGSSGNHNTPVATQAPAAHVVKPTATKAAPTATPKPKAWHILAPFSGNGNQQSADFKIQAANWRLVWGCMPSSFDGSSYNLIVDVDNVDQTQLGDLGAINTICQAGNASGTTNIHDLGAGTYYLNVTSEAAWTVDVEVYS